MIGLVAVRATMPKLDGAIVDPRYVPEHRRPAYLAEWGHWLRTNTYREPWMEDLIAAMKAQGGEMRGQYANRRDLAEPEIVNALARVGALVERLDYPVDLLVQYRGRTMLLEVKTPGASKGPSVSARRKAQIAFCAMWRVPIVHTPDEALFAIGALRELSQ